MENRDRRTVRLIRELELFADEPPWGITCCARVDDVYDVLVARMKGPEGSPYESGTFELEINIPETYPFAPPLIKFITPIRHPNIDKNGHICIDALKTGAGFQQRLNGEWTPAIKLRDLLVNIQALLTDPNIKDPLMMDLAEEYRQDREKFFQKTREHTEKYAKT